MKVTVALLLTLVAFLVGHTHGEYRVKVHPPIPPPPPFKFSVKGLRGGGGGGNSLLGPPRFHHHHHPAIVHHPHGLHHHHGHHGPPHKAFLRPIHVSHQSLLASLPSHPPPPPVQPPSALVHHLHHHHLPPTLRPSFKAPWKGPQGPKDTFHPSPPDGAQAIVATHQTVDDNKGPIHTIPAPNLGPSGKHPHPRPVITLGSYNTGGQGSGFQTAHGIGQGVVNAGGPYPNPVYGKPATADLTYHEPPIVQPEPQLTIPTIKIQGSYGYQVHEHESLVTPAPIFTQVTTLSPGGAYFAPDPDPSLPAAKIPYTLDPHSHPSNGQSPPDLEQEIPQHLLTLYGFNQPSQNVHLQPAQVLQHQHQVVHSPQLSAVAIPGEVVHQGGAYVPADLGGQLTLSEALAQFEIQSQPETYSQVAIHQTHAPHQAVRVIHQGQQAHLVPEYQHQTTFEQVRNPTSVSVQPAPLVSSTHETVYHPLGSPPQLGGEGHFTAYDLFANSPVNSPVLDALKENFHQHPTSTPAPPTAAPPSPSVINNHFQYQLPLSTTVAPPSSTPVGNAIYHHQQQFISTTAEPPVANNVEYQPQLIHDLTQGSVIGGQSFNDLYHSLGAVALEGHQAQSVSVTNPGQAGYIAASYHSQQAGSPALSPQLHTQVYSPYGQDSFSAETRLKTTSSSADASQVSTLINSLPPGIPSVSLRKGTETVRPSSSSSFYSEKTVRVGNPDPEQVALSSAQQEPEEEPEYYDEEVSQEVDSEDEKNARSPQPSGYGASESYDGKVAEEEDKNGQEYGEKDEDYPTHSKGNQNDGSNSGLDGGKTQKLLPLTTYNRNVEFGTRLRPKKNN